MDPALPGVGARFGCFRKGDSGRGAGGRIFPLDMGLTVRAPGPMDWENLGIEGVLGLKCGRSMDERLKLLYDGVVGVGGKDSEDRVREARLVALWMGKKMPAPDTLVVKYRVLQSASEHGPRH